MGIFARLETFLERLFEAPAGRLGANLQPVSLAKRIERAMDTNKSFGDAGVIVPNVFDVHLHPVDFATFESFRGSLQDDLAQGVLTRARRERYTLVARPRVRLVPDPAVPRRDVRVAANVADDAGEHPRDAVARPVSPHTMILARPGHEAPDGDRRVSLRVRTPGAPPVEFELGGALISIGRADDNDVIIDDPEVSRHHGQLKLQHGSFAFADMGSRNGSTVNGQAVTEVALSSGDLITMGSTEIEFAVRG
jgi:hypothetical protein